MGRDSKVKLLVAFSLVFFVFLALKYRTDYLIFYISLVASAIQIILFIVWYLEDHALINDMSLNIETVKEVVTKKDEDNIYRQNIIRKIVNKGKVDQEEVKKLIAKLENKDMVSSKGW